VSRAGAAVLVTLAASFLAAELGVRAWYASLSAETARWPILYEAAYWGAPPWTRWASVLEADRGLVAWMKPNVERTYVNLFGPLPDLDDVDRLFAQPGLEPDWIKTHSAWTLRTNSLGMRGGEVGPKTPGRPRIAALGDSWTVGVNVEEDEAYPSVVGRLLNAEVLNLGRMGASGLVAPETLRRKALPLDPDAVVVAFGQNDEYRLHGAKPGARGRLRVLLEKSEVLRLALWGIDRKRMKIREALVRSAFSPWVLPANADEPCEMPGVENGPYARAIEETLAEASRRKLPAVLLYASLPDGRRCAGDALAAVARRAKVPFIDGSKLLKKEILAREAAPPPRVKLPPPAPTKTLLVLRASKPGAADGSLRARLAASREGGEWRSVGPLRDDGKGPDEKAGDGVHTLALELDADQDVAWILRDGPPEKNWRGVENYAPRRWRLHASDAGRAVWLPVAAFGGQTLRSDLFHADAEGYAILARAVAKELEKVLPRKTK
jgi:lysophospholipase L1-like esterase